MTNGRSNTVPTWSARTHILTGCVALVIFFGFWATWAGTDTVSGVRVVEGTLVSNLGDVSEDPPTIKLSDSDAKLTILVAQPFEMTTQDNPSATLTLTTPSQTTFAELPGTIAGVMINGRGATIEIVLSDMAIARSKDILLVPGMPASVLIDTPPRAPLAFLLDPIFAYF